MIVELMGPVYKTREPDTAIARFMPDGPQWPLCFTEMILAQWERVQAWKEPL